MIKSEEDLAKAILAATGPIRIVGGGTRVVGGGDAISTAGLTGITLYEPGALTMVAQAGTPVAEIEAALEAEGQRLAFEPYDLSALLGTSGRSTIGGVFATNASGPRRIQAGAARDFLLGVRYVDGMGRIVKNGGRVMKNVTGYDLVKLMSGAWGRIGVLTEVSFKVLPKPERIATLTIDGLSDDEAIAALAAALGSPFDVTGAAHLNGQTMLRIEGFAPSVEYRLNELIKVLGRFGAARVSDDADWAAVRDAAPFAGQEGDVWRISVKPSDAPELVRRIAPKDVIYDWGGGLIWALTAAGQDVRSVMGDGHATLLRADSATYDRLGRFHPEPPAVAALTNGLRAKFDPRGIFHLAGAH